MSTLGKELATKSAPPAEVAASWAQVASKYRELELAQVAEAQHGLFTYAQARALGIANATLARRVKEGRWLQRRRGVYAIAGHPQTRHGEILEAVLASGPEAVASRFTAAELHGLHNVWPRRLVDVSIPNTTRRRLRGVNVRRNLRGVVANRGGIPVTSVLETLLDLVPWLKEDALELTIMDAVRRELLDADDLQRRVNGLRGSGRKAIAKLRRIVGAGNFRRMHQSILEARVHQILAALRDVPEYLSNVPIDEGDVRIGTDFDIVIPSLKIVIECDGLSHQTREQQAKDRARTKALRAAGWIVLRVKWRQTLGTADRLKRRLQRALDVAKKRRRIFPVPKPKRTERSRFLGPAPQGWGMNPSDEPRRPVPRAPS